MAGGVYAYGDGNVWGATGPGAESVLADGFVSFHVCIGDCGVGRVRIVGNHRWTGESGKCEDGARTADRGEFFGIVGDAAGDRTECLHADCAVAGESGGTRLGQLDLISCHKVLSKVRAMCAAEITAAYESAEKTLKTAG